LLKKTIYAHYWKKKEGKLMNNMEALMAELIRELNDFKGIEGNWHEDLKTGELKIPAKTRRKIVRKLRKHWLIFRSGSKHD